MAIEGSSFELGVISDPKALRQFLSELEVVPAALRRISAAINAVDLGDGRKFAGDGRKLAEAFVQGARSEMSGGSFQRAFREAMSGVDLRIPPEAQAHLRADLERINAEIRRLVPQQVQIGVRANTSGASFREVLQAGAPQAFSAQQAQQETRSLSEMRELARELRQSAKQAELGTTRARSGGASAQELLKAADLVDRTSERYQTAAARLAEATDKGARTLERVATREEVRSASEQRFPGGPDAREEALARATESTRTQRAIRQLGLEQPNGFRLDTELPVGASEPITPFRKFVAANQRATQDEAATAQARADKDAAAAKAKADKDAAAAQAKAAAEQKKTDEQREKNAKAERDRLSLLDKSNQSDGAFLARAGQTAQRRRIAAQQAIESDDKFPPGKFEQLLEDSNARKLRGAATAESLRGTAGGDIKAGIIGTSGVSFLERQASIISTTASFALGGQAFQAVLNGLTEVVSGTRQFEDALSNLSVTFGDSTNNLRGFATEVGKEANAVGLTQAQGVEAASKSVGLFNTNGQSEQDKQDFAKLAVQVTGRIAQQGGTSDLSGVETNLAGILRSFQLSNSDLTRVEDSLAVISKQSGGNPAEILQAASETATLARSAGFDAFQNSAIIANQATTTGQTAGAAAEQLAQVFAQSTNAAVTAKFNTLGINTNQSLAGQVQELSGKVQSGQISQEELGSISALFGRSRSGAAFRNLVEGLPRVNQLADQARNSPGEGQKQFEEIFGNISSEITKTVGALRNVATELAQSGLLDILGETVIVVHHVADALTDLLHAFNELPRWLRSGTLQLGELIIAMRLFGTTAAASRLLALAGGTTRIGQAVVTRVAGAEAASSLAARFGGAGPAAGGILPLLTNPATIAAIAAVSGLIAAQKIDAANSAASRAEDRAFFDPNSTGSASRAATSTDLRGAASARRQAAKAEQDRRDAFLGLGNVVDFFGGSDAAKATNRDNRLADSLDARAGVVQKQEDSAKAKTAELFGRFNSPDEVTAQLQRLQAEGATAAQRVKALSDAFDSIAATAHKAGVAVLGAGSGGQFANRLGAALTGAIGEGAGQAGLRAGSLNTFDQGGFLANKIAGVGSALDVFGGFNTPHDKEGEQKLLDLQKKLQGTDTAKLQTDLSQKTQALLAQRGVDTSKADAVLNQGDIDAIKQLQSDELEKFIRENIPSGPEFDEIRRTLRNSLKVNLAKLLNQLPKAGPLDADQAVNFLDATGAAADQAFNDTSFRDKSAASATRVKTLGDALAKAKAAVGSQGSEEGSKAGRQGTLDRLADAQNKNDKALADDQKVQLESTVALIHLRESKRGRLDQAGRLQDEIDAATAAVAAATDPTDKNNAQVALNNLLAQKQQLALDTAASIAGSKIDPRDSAALARQAVTDATNALNDTKKHGDKKAVADATTRLAQANAQNLQTQIAIANSNRLAKVQPGDDIAAANAALANAQNDLSGLLKGSEAYNNKLVEITNLQKQVADSVNARRNNKRLLSIDLTDPVAQATAERKAAEDALRSAKGPDARDRARLDLRQKQASEEAAKFQQRLGDVQTADELGRISHQQYIAYLQSEHDRLSAVKVRTRDQINELNQVDTLLKSAKEALSGQFNIGDIKLPTVYEVRRAIKAGAGGILAANNAFSGASAGQVVNDNSQRTLVLQGISIEEVMRRITALYGGAPVRTKAGRKR